MTDLQTILEGIDELPLDALQQIEQHIAERRILETQDDTDAEVWIADLHGALAEFRDGLSEDQLRQITNDMNIGYISPKELRTLEDIIAWVGVVED